MKRIAIYAGSDTSAILWVKITLLNYLILSGACGRAIGKTSVFGDESQ